MNLDKEVWEDITLFPGYEGYQISNHGRVRSNRKRNRNAIGNKWRILTPNKTPAGGYSWISLYGEGSPRKVRVHALVADKFLGPKPEGSIILHLDDNPENNHVSNLRYGSPRENAIDKSINRRKHTVLKYLDEVANYCHAIAESKSFWDYEASPDVYLAKMALVHSEVSEILEAYRKEMGAKKITEEFADVFIRLVDLWSAMNEDGLTTSLREAILDKIENNKSRPKKHGRLI